MLTRRRESNHEFENQTVLVSGAGRGIGKEIALSFAREGADTHSPTQRGNGSGDVPAKSKSSDDASCTAAPT